MKFIIAFILTITPIMVSEKVATKELLFLK